MPGRASLPVQGRESRPDPSRQETTMSTQLSHQRSRHWMATRQAGPRLGRLATVLAAVISGLLASVPLPRPRSLTRYRSGTGTPSPSSPARDRPGDHQRWHGGLADRPDRGRGRPGRCGRGRARGPQAGQPSRRHRYRRLMRPSATTHRACLTTGPPGPNRQAGPRLALSQARKWRPDPAHRPVITRLPFASWGRGAGCSGAGRRAGSLP